MIDYQALVKTGFREKCSPADLPWEEVYCEPSSWGLTNVWGVKRGVNYFVGIVESKRLAQWLRDDKLSGRQEPIEPLRAISVTAIPRIQDMNHQQLKMMAPPLSAVFLFYLFLPASDCYALVGDLEERYRIIFVKFGKGKADFWYWTQAIRSVGPVAWMWFTKLVMKPVLRLSKWAIGAGLIEKGATSEFVKALLAEAMKRIRG